MIANTIQIYVRNSQEQSGL